MLLIELKGNPNLPTFGPTEKFQHLYGNYGGRGNRGGEPIDIIDAACKKHDMCYYYQGRDNPECDKALVKDMEDLDGVKLTIKQRAAAQLIKLFFKRRLRANSAKKP